MKIENKLDLLRQIKEVDAPPFLFTRIRQQVQNMQNIEAPLKWKWTFVLTSVLILILNVSAFLKQFATTQQNNSAIETVVNSINLATSNNIYHE